MPINRGSRRYLNTQWFFHGFVGKGSNQWPLSQKKEYDEYPVVPRIGEEVIINFASSASDGRWLVRAVRHLIRQGPTPEGVIVDLIPVHH